MSWGSLAPTLTSFEVLIFGYFLFCFLFYFFPSDFQINLTFSCLLKVWWASGSQPSSHLLGTLHSPQTLQALQAQQPKSQGPLWLASPIMTQGQSGPVTTAGQETVGWGWGRRLQGTDQGSVLGGASGCGSRAPGAGAGLQPGWICRDRSEHRLCLPAAVGEYANSGR